MAPFFYHFFKASLLIVYFLCKTVFDTQAQLTFCHPEYENEFLLLKYFFSYYIKDDYQN